MNGLRNLQNKVVRYITHSSPYTNVSNEYRKLGILKLDQIYFSEVGKFMFRKHKHTLPLSFDGYYKNINHNHNTRTRLHSEFSLPCPRTELGKQSIKYTGVKIWSEISNDLKNSTNLQSFSTMIKSHILSNVQSPNIHDYL